MHLQWNTHATVKKNEDVLHVLIGDLQDIQFIGNDELYFNSSLP